MLNDCPIEETQRAVLKLAATHEASLTTKLLRRGIAPQNIKETVSALTSSEMPLSAQDVVDEAFRAQKRGRLPYRTGRFSDGTIGVYYSAIDKETCERERAFHLESEIAEIRESASQHPRYYNLVSCRYSGITADLRGQEDTHIDLVSQTEQGYPFCQQVGLQAKELNIDGFLAPSARNRGGTCVPIFKRSAISKPRIVAEVKVLINDTIEFQDIN